MTRMVKMTRMDEISDPADQFAVITYICLLRIPIIFTIAQAHMGSLISGRRAQLFEQFGVRLPNWNDADLVSANLNVGCE